MNKLNETGFGKIIIYDNLNTEPLLEEILKEQPSNIFELKLAEQIPLKTIVKRKQHNKYPNPYSKKRK